MEVIPDKVKRKGDLKNGAKIIKNSKNQPIDLLKPQSWLTLPPVSVPGI